MRRLTVLALLIGIVLIGGIAVADEASEVKVDLRQHFLFVTTDGFKGLEQKNATGVTILRTTSIDGAPKWVNTLVDGWGLDACAGYEDVSIRDGALVLGRNFGTLGEYFPWLIFPFKDRLQISLDIGGAYFNNIQHEFKPKYCFGIGYIEAKLKF